MSDEPLSATETEAMHNLLGSPIFFPKEFKDWMADYGVMNLPLIPFSHIFGSHINIARSGDYVITSETTASGSYTDLATVGPQVTQLADGTYLVGYGVRSRSPASVSVNGNTPSDNDQVFAQESSDSNSRHRLWAVNSNNANSFKLQYQAGTFSHRWLYVIRIGAYDPQYA